MSIQTTPTLEVTKIDVEDGFNARTSQSADGLERLSASITTEGLIQPLLVKAGTDGRATVIAGHRRLAAAKLAGIERVPVTYYEGDRERPASLVENLHREDLDPIDAARGLKAIAEEFNLTTNKDIAAQVNMSVQWVGDRLRLLKLPEGCQTRIASGQVPVEAERLLRKIAEVSPRIAECVCEMAVRRKVATRDFVREFGDLLAETAEGRFEDKPTMIDARSVGFDVVADREERADLLARYEAMRPHLLGSKFGFRLGEADLDAVRAARCLVEHKVDEGGFYTSVAYITDRESSRHRPPDRRVRGGGREEAGRGRGSLAGALGPDRADARRAEGGTEGRAGKGRESVRQGADVQRRPRPQPGQAARQRNPSRAQPDEGEGRGRRPPRRQRQPARPRAATRPAPAAGRRGEDAEVGRGAPEG
jgi:ParB family transcriptional regulator, chromosome partitioning protein